ncbi:MAG: DMT family transporter [Gammaproteobacteria bacterium]|nr:DMT family transporter [Gammaproteobacteria bacterium]MDH3971347.1 DMT family transporter [Gammaproteobacteria bacterium]MDH3986276.1 DMT family transporter [Gammaproteobacteria bacterium]
MHWISLTLLSAFFLATADSLSKRYLSHYRPGELVLVRFGVAGMLLLPLLLWEPWPPLPPVFWGWMAVAMPLELVAMWLYMQAIRSSPLSLTLPYLAFTPAFNTLTAYLVLGETVTLSGFSGILLIVFGAWLLNLQATQNGSGLNILAPFRAITRERGSRLMLMVAALYSLTSVTGKGALLHVTPAFFGPFYFVALGTASLLLFASRDVSSWRALGRHPWAHLAIGACMSAMVVAHFYAIEHIEVAYMIAVKRTSLLFGMLYGAWLFKETGLLKNLVAGMLMVLGVFLIVM